MTPGACGEQPPAGSVAEVAEQDGRFTVLAGTYVGLLDSCSRRGPHTGFAPTDEAFAKLDERLRGAWWWPASLEELFRDRNTVGELIKYHDHRGHLRRSTRSLSVFRLVDRERTVHPYRFCFKCLGKMWSPTLSSRIRISGYEWSHPRLEMC